MNYLDHLYNYSILNEVYFGKTTEIKLLQKLLNVYMNFAYTETPEYDLSKYELKILKNTKKKYINTKINKYLQQNPQANKSYSNINFDSDADDYFERLLLLIKEAFEAAFGLANLEIALDNNFGAVHVFYKENLYIDSQGRIGAEDGAGNDILLKEIKKHIIVTDYGMYFDSSKVYITGILLLPNLVNIRKYRLNEKEITAVLLHEMGHIFSAIFFDSIEFPHSYKSKEYRRADEIFADKFVSLYGYSKELISFFKKIDSIPFISKDKYLKDISDKHSIKNQSNLNNNSSDVHPQTYARLWSLLQQLKLEEKDKKISPEQRKKITKEIDKVKKAIRDYKYNPRLYFPKEERKNFSPEELENYKKYYKNQNAENIVYNLSMDEKDRQYQKQSKADFRRIKQQIDDIYEKSSKE